MSTLQYPKDQWIVVLTDNARCGGISLGNHEQLKYITKYIYIKGSIAGIERLRIKLYTDSSYSKLWITSNWVNLSTIENIAANWRGIVRFDFNEEHLHRDANYYMLLESGNYTRNADTFYISMLFNQDELLFDKYDYKIFGKRILT